MSEFGYSPEELDLLQRYEDRKDCIVALARGNEPQRLFGCFTLEEIIKLPELINRETK